MPISAEDQSRFSFQSLRLQNFRKFADLTVELDPYFNAIVAENGGGKSALLDALAISLSPFVSSLEGRSSSDGFKASDVRLAQDPDGKMAAFPPCRIEASAEISSVSIHWNLSSAKDEPQAAEELKALAERLETELQEYAERQRTEAPSLPLIAYYSGREWQHPRLPRAREGRSRVYESRVSGYQNCLGPYSSWPVFRSWFERMSREAQGEASTPAPSPHRPQLMLSSVRKAVDEVLEPLGWRSLAWDFVQNTLVASHDTAGRLPVESLSDGIRMVIALVADLAHRAARLNPHFGEEATLKSPGIVLIDEVDLHLHPRWQQLIVPALRAAFPRVQFIVTTHSDRVLSTVPASSIRVLDDEGQVHVPGTQTQGNSADYILADIFEVDPVPPEANAERLNRYRHLIEDGLSESPEAKIMRTQLEAHFGQGHPALIEVDRLKRFQAFKLRRQIGT